jgi:hypothetical protein
MLVFVAFSRPRFPPRVWVYDVKNEVPVESKLIGEPFQARVHGLSLIRDDKDNLLVFVIEHTPNKTDAVKVLQYNEQEKTLYDLCFVFAFAAQRTLSY